MQIKIYVAAAGLVLLLAPGAVSAHHAFAAEFDANKPVSLKGTITEIDWINPHIWLHVEVKQPDGKLVEWMVEGGAPNAMFRRGWNKESVAPGTVVSIEGYRAKNGENKANGKDILLPDGRKLFLGSSGTGAPYNNISEGQKK